MPEFIPQHTPTGVDDFLRGYLAAAEWLCRDATDAEGRGDSPEDVAGFSPEALEEARKDCADFEQANAADLAEYYRLTQRGPQSAGHDFYLTRNGHGAGFWDRGAGPAGDRLSEAAKVYGTADCEAEPGGLMSFTA